MSELPPARRKKPAKLLTFLILLGAVGIFLFLGGDDREDLEQTGPISDFANVYSAQDATNLAKTAIQVARETGSEIAIVSLNTDDRTSGNRAANALFKRWEIGERSGTGALIVALPSEGRIVLAMDSGSESRSTYPLLRQAQAEAVQPLVVEGLWYDATYSMLVALRDFLKGSESGTPEPSVDSGGNLIALALLCFGLIAGAVVLAIFVKSQQSPDSEVETSGTDLGEHDRDY